MPEPSPRRNLFPVIARLLFLFRRSRIDRSGRLEQGARTDFRPHGLRRRHGSRRVHGGSRFGQRVDRAARRALEPADRAVCVAGAWRRRDRRNFLGRAGRRPRGVCRGVSLTRREMSGALLALRFAGSALVLFLPTFLMGGTLPVLVRGVTRNFRAAWDAPFAPVLDQHGRSGCRNICGGISFFAVARFAAHAWNRRRAKSRRRRAGAFVLAREEPDPLTG